MWHARVHHADGRPGAFTRIVKQDRPAPTRKHGPEPPLSKQTVKQQQQERFLSPRGKSQYLGRNPLVHPEWGESGNRKLYL